MYLKYCALMPGIYLCIIYNLFWTFRPTPQVKHYHIKQNSKLEFFLSEKHCCPTIAELVNYHRYDITCFSKQINIPTRKLRAFHIFLHLNFVFRLLPAVITAVVWRAD